jgi:S1-C subfamily serine protease
VRRPHRESWRAVVPLGALLAFLLSGCGDQSASGSGVESTAAKVRPATVLVLNLTQSNNPSIQNAGILVQQGAGTGFIYDGAGYIATNDHVIVGAQGIRVVLPPPDNRSFDAQLVGADAQTDLAVLKITGQHLPTLALGQSSKLQIGEQVVAIGNALALPGGPTVTSGVVSALDRDARELTTQQGTAGPTLYNLIQTDAAINPGNSGGPLVNTAGQVVGINTLGTTDAQGIGFAISIDGAKPVIDELQKTGHVTRAFLGIQGASLTPGTAATLGLNGTQQGVLVISTVSNSPASQAGVQARDVLVGINNVTIHDMEDLQLALQNTFKPGQSVQLHLVRNGSPQTLKATLGQQPQT